MYCYFYLVLNCSNFFLSLFFVTNFLINRVTLLTRINMKVIEIFEKDDIIIT